MYFDVIIGLGVETQESIPWIKFRQVDTKQRENLEQNMEWI